MTALCDLMRERIAETGPIALRDYMALCLTHPQWGYYTRRDPLGAAGDFITAPEISQIFGELIGLWMVDLWERAGAPGEVTVLELGPGRGTLMADARRAAQARPAFVAAHQVLFMDASRTLRQEQAQRVPDALWIDGLDVPILRNGAGPLLVIANEFFDALPVEQYVYRRGIGWRLRAVTWDVDAQRLVDCALPCTRIPPVPAGLNLRDGDVFEDASEGKALLRQLASLIRQRGGAMLMIDYGHDLAGLGDTFQAMANHAPVDPLMAPGDADLTCHVAFDPLRQVAVAEGLRASATLSQGRFLRALGLDVRAAQLARAEADKPEAVLSGARRLADPDQMGALFKVLALWHPDWPRPEGLS